MKWKLINKNIKSSPDGIDLPDEVYTLLHARGLETVEQIGNFVNPSKDDLHDPLLLPDAEKGIKRILKARDAGEKVVIYGDYDADGVTATSILWKFLYRELEIDVVPYIPSRFSEGYGLNESAVESLAKKGVSLIITVDCGIKDSEIIEKFPGVDFIVTDHHTLPEDENFKHLAIHPARGDSKYPFKTLAGAGVSWKFICAIAKYLNEKKGLDLDPFKYVDLAAIGTVADIMPLVGENRAIVKLGLEKIREGKNVGLNALMNIAGRDIKKADTYDIGFVIGPRINAAGRMENAMIAVKLFSTEDEHSASKLAEYLNSLNLQRQEQTQTMMDGALSQISEEDNFLFVYDENWNEGIVGLVAGKLKEMYYKPVVAATKSNGLITGSARSIQGINIIEVITKQESLLVRFGGHAQAAGLSFEEGNIKEVKAAIAAYIKSNFGKEIFERVLEIDLELDLSKLTMDFFKQLQQLAPFGEGNREPVFAFKNLQVLKIFKFGQDNRHIKFVVTDKNRKQFVQVLGFGKGEEFSHVEIGNTIDIAGRISLNEWNGQKSLQIILNDLNLK